MDQRTRQGQLLLHPPGEILGLPLPEAAQPAERQELLDALLEGLAHNAVDAGLEEHVLVNRQLRVQAEALRNIAEPALDLVRLLQHVVPRHTRRPRSRLQGSAKHPHGRRLPRTIGADQPEDLALQNGEVEVIHRHDITE